MSKSKESKDEEYHKGIIRGLKKQLIKLQQENKRLLRELGYGQNKTEKPRRTKEIEDECQSCGKGLIKVSDLGIRKIISCTLCDYRKIIK